MFWFNRNPGLSLPLIALQYHEVKIIMDFRTAAELVVGLTAAGNRDFAANTTSIYDSSGVVLQSAALWVNYIFIRRMKKQPANLGLGKQLVASDCENVYIFHNCNTVKLFGKALSEFSPEFLGFRAYATALG